MVKAELKDSAWVQLWLGEGRAQGEARGEARAVLRLLDRQGISVPEDARELILACRDLDQLDAWIDRAVGASSIDDVLTD